GRGGTRRRLARRGLALRRAGGATGPRRGPPGGRRRPSPGRRRSRAGAARDLTRLLGQPVDALEDVVDVRPRAGLLGLSLELLDRGARSLVGVAEPLLDLAAQVRRDPLLCLAQRLPPRPHRAVDDAGTPARPLSRSHA